MNSFWTNMTHWQCHCFVAWLIADSGMHFTTNLWFQDNHSTVDIRWGQEDKDSKSESVEAGQLGMSHRLLLLLFCLEVFRHDDPSGAQVGPEPSAAKSLIWGPGLETNIVLPARFFYIQAVDSSGKKYVKVHWLVTIIIVSYSTNKRDYWFRVRHKVSLNMPIKKHYKWLYLHRLNSYQVIFYNKTNLWLLYLNYNNYIFIACVMFLRQWIRKHETKYIIWSLLWILKFYLNKSYTYINKSAITICSY